MRQFDNPALRAFIGQLHEELVLAQVLIRRKGAGWELRNVADRDKIATQLGEVTVESLRELVQFNSLRAFRPLKSSPDLIDGWRCIASDDESLGDALNRIYPGAVVDWFAAKQSPPPVTSYREFTGRQSGMYRITTMLNDVQAGLVIRAACHRNFCLKHRLWSVPGLATDSVDAKSAIPCLEPCAILLEFARKSARMEQEEKVPVPLSPSELTDLQDLIGKTVAGRPASGATTDEQRRWQLIGEKLAALPNTPVPSPSK